MEIKVWSNGCGFTITGIEPTDADILFGDDSSELKTEDNDHENPILCAQWIAHEIWGDVLRNDWEQAQKWLAVAKDFDKIVPWVGMMRSGTWTKYVDYTVYIRTCFNNGKTSDDILHTVDVYHEIMNKKAEIMQYVEIDNEAARDHAKYLANEIAGLIKGGK